MAPFNRRDFFSGIVAAGTTLAASSLSETEAQQPAEAAESAPATWKGEAGNAASDIDFRYAPALRQTAFCFPDDPHKSLIDQAGQLLYGYDSADSLVSTPYTTTPLRCQFSRLKVGFALRGMKTAKVMSQKLESPAVPILRTVLEYPRALMALTTFATNDRAEGRVDNVIVEITPRSDETINVEPLIEFDTVEKFDLEEKDGSLIVLHRKSREVLLAGKVLGNQSEASGHGSINNFDIDSDRSQQLIFHRGQASKAKPYRAFFRFPLAMQEKTLVVAGGVVAGLSDPERCLEGCRTFWKSLSVFHEPVS